jgi:Ca2+-binding RTX toxin-like protein
MRTIVFMAAAAAVFAAASPAHAAVTCNFAAGTATVSMSAAGDSASIAVGTGANAGRIMVGVTACGTGTTANTDTIVVNGTTGAENVTIDLSAGQFAPGASVEGSGASEIEFVVDLSSGVADRITFVGSGSADTVTLGAGGANLNADNDIDVLVTNAELGTFTGSDGNDLLSGAGDGVTGAPTILNLTMAGDGGADSLMGGGGDDTITGGPGSNSLSGGAGDDTVTGGQGDDLVAGDDGGDTLSGGLGNDVFDEGVDSNGTDTLAGGGGNDIVTYGGRSAGVVVTLDGVFDDGQAGESDNVGTDIENAVGGAGDNVMTGSGSANDLTGGLGDDILDGAGGDDTLNGGAGSDRLTGGAGNDNVFGDDGADTVLEGAGNDNVQAGTSPDVDTLDYSGVTGGVTLSLALTSPQVTGGAGTDTVSDFDHLTGGSGADVLGGDGAPNVVSGGAGNDSILGDDGDDTISGDAGTDTVDYSAFATDVTVTLGPAAGTSPGSAVTTLGNDTLLGLENVTGGTGNDVLTGEAGANVLTGNDGDDTLAGLRGNDTLDGAAGSDTLDYSAADAGVTLNLSSLAAQNTGGAGTDTVANAENLVGSAFGDSFAGTVGANVLDGGPGTDTADYSGSGLGVTVDLSLAGPQDTGTAGTDTLADMESLTGGAGRDVLTGGPGANTISAGAGNDTVVASAGGDVLDGGTGSDTLDYSARPAGVTVNLTSGVGNSSGDTDLLTTFENVLGTSGADLLVGDGAVNTLTGADGNDVLRGLAGADSLAGGTGVDMVDYSTFFPANGRIGVVVNLATGDAVGDGADALTGLENVRGSNFDDRLFGNAQANTLQGWDGRDYVYGAGGQDVLQGGDDADTIVSRDGVRDQVNGGADRDKARVDRGRDAVKSVAVFLP